tara:strand:+ start:220 stop:831 length:612 start_codon:yes stop_codon:yes gene_type:complete
MDEINYALFISTSLIINAAPGPDVVFVISNFKHRGWSAAILSIMGLALGYLFHVIITYLGISALIASSPLLFNILKYLGAAYLIWLGANVIYETVYSKKNNTQETQYLPKDRWKYLTQGFITSALNPKVSIFFLAFIPQFLPENSTESSLVFILGMMFCFGATFFNFFYCYLSTFVRSNKKENKLISGLPGCLLIGIGIYMAF